MLDTSTPVNIYPVLPTEGVKDVNAFRLNKINNIRKEILVERNERERTYQKYNKIDVTLSIVETMAETVAIGVGAVGIASVATVVAAPVGFVLVGLAIGLGGAATAIKFARYNISKKKKKHDEIIVLAESKLNSFDNHVSKAIQNGIINQEEFCFNQRNKYSEMKENIRTKFIPKESPKDTPNDVKQIDDKEKKEIIDKIIKLK